MKTYRYIAASFALAGLVPVAASAQSAPIRQGVTSSDIAEQASRLQQSNAELRLQIRDMQVEIAQLNGKIETLEFLLSQNRDEINRMQGDDQEIGRQLSTIIQRLDTLDGRIDSLNSQMAVRTSDTVSDSAPRSGDGAQPEMRTITVRRADGTVTRRSVPVEAATGSAQPKDTGDADLEQAIDNQGPEISPAQTGSLGTISAADLPGEAGPLFQEAKSRLLQFDYPRAETAFRAFLEAFGDDPQAGEAQYWLGEVLYQQDQYQASGAAYTEMIQTWPDDPRAPDALVKLARSMRLIDQVDKACAALDLLARKYPDASSVTRNLAAVESTRSGCAG